MRNEVMEMHLFDAEAAEEQALCGKHITDTERISVGYYLEECLRGHPVGTVCERCKALAVPLAEDIMEEMAQDFEDEGRLGDAEDCRGLLNRLVRRRGLDRGLGIIHVWAFSCVSGPIPVIGEQVIQCMQ